MHRGNYPNAPASPIFGAIGLIGAMGSWAKSVKYLDMFQKVVHQIANNTIYMVSYEGSLMKQERLGHHIARLAETVDIPKVLQGLFHIQLYNEEENKPDNPKRKVFFIMASRFLQLYTKSSFQDFLSFRGEYPIHFSPILEDYFMNQQKITEELIRSAKSYGTHLNSIAFFAADAEVKEGKTKRDIYEAKSKNLAELESAIMSTKNPSELFSIVNIRAGRISDREVSEADVYPFMEAVMLGDIPFKDAQNMLLAFLRVSSFKKKTIEEVEAENTTQTEEPSI